MAKQIMTETYSMITQYLSRLKIVSFDKLQLSTNPNWISFSESIQTYLRRSLGSFHSSAPISKTVKYCWHFSRISSMTMPSPEWLSTSFVRQSQPLNRCPLPSLIWVESAFATSLGPNHGFSSNWLGQERIGCRQIQQHGITILSIAPWRL